MSVFLQHYSNSWHSKKYLSEFFFTAGTFGAMENKYQIDFLLKHFFILKDMTYNTHPLKSITMWFHFIPVVNKLGFGKT